jgi:hypothetical protein
MGVWKETKRLARYKVAENRAQEAALYAQVMEELEQGNRDKGLWGKALAETEGDEAKANARYMKLRVQALADLLNVSADMAQRAEESIAERVASRAAEEAKRIDHDKIAAQYMKVAGLKPVRTGPLGGFMGVLGALLKALALLFLVILAIGFIASIFDA